MRLTTPVELPADNFEITHRTKIMSLGSCFVQNIGDRLAACKFDTDNNPFGVLYNPLSIAAALNRIADGSPFSADDLFFHQERWHSMMHHGCFSHPSRSEALAAINGRLALAHERLGSLNLLVLTFGTAYVYRCVSDNMVAGNCHKLPASSFVRSLCSVEEIVSEVRPMLERLLAARPLLKILFTVSPIRHLRDGAHGNRVSKATLILAVDELRRLFPLSTLYFPAYEILLDELRDYRFYAEDMSHPSSTATEYIWERFGECYFGAETRELNSRIDEITRAVAHRPVNPASDSHRKFVAATLNKIELLKKEHPYLDFEKETALCNIQLNR